VPIARRIRHTEISIYSPATFDEARIAADNLKEGRAVVLNLSRIDVENGKRIVDFLSGILYALEGSSKKSGTTSSCLRRRTSPSRRKRKQPHHAPNWIRSSSRSADAEHGQSARRRHAGGV